MIVATGVDLTEIARIARMVQEHGQRFLDRIYTEAEQAYCLRKHAAAESLASRFAAKEAVMKCLGTGWSDGVGFRQIEVVRNPGSPPTLRLHGRAQELAAALGIARWHVSLSHDRGLALAFVVAES